MEEVIAHAIESIQQSALQSDPFLHFHRENIFPEEFYQELIGNFPDISYYKNSADYPERYVLNLTERSLEKLPLFSMLFWRQFAQAMTSISFAAAVIEKFQPQIKKRFGDQIVMEDFYIDVSLICDHAHYSIGPHTDHPAKVITLLFYFPASDDQIDLGTALYRPKDPTFRCEGTEHYPFQGFIKTGQAPFLPNSVFGFLKTNNSFHGVEPLGKQEKERNLMTYTIWKKQ